jgi:hypothetical protein
MTANPIVAGVLTHVFAWHGARADRRKDVGQGPSFGIRVCIGLGIPFLAIVPTIPLLSRLDWLVFGVPAEVAWLFCCIPLTSACLAFCWFGHDRYRDEG